MVMKTLGVILARAGSVGLPRKNELDLLGKPMVMWTIDHALASTGIDHVVLSTDGDKLATIGEQAGIDVVYRPADLAHNTATVDAAARHAVMETEKITQQRYEYVVILYGNVPVRPADLSDRALDKLASSGADSVQSVAAVEKMHPYWMKRVDHADGDRLLMYEENHVYRRQDLPPVYMLDGGVIAVRRESLFVQRDGEPHAFLGADRRAVMTQPGEVVDIDSKVDMLVAKAILQEKQSANGDSANGDVKG